MKLHAPLLAAALAFGIPLSDALVAQDSIKLPVPEAEAGKLRQFETVVDRIREELKIPAVSAAIVKNQEIPVLSVGSQLSGQNRAPLDWKRANEATVRLRPSAFPDLRPAVRRKLERRDCRIPQTFSNNAPHNIVKGRFTTSTQEDLAVLCSNGRDSSILVFRGGSAALVAELARAPDANSLQVVAADGTIGFSRGLGVADPKFLREHHERYGGPQPPPLDHDGINDIFVGKGSVVWYWYGGHWLRLTGAD